MIDKPDYCDFSFGAIVNRSPLVVAISTDGAAPVFAQAIRSRIEAMLPAGFARWADAARQLARRGEAIGSLVQRPPAVLAEFHTRRLARSERRTIAGRF